MFSFLNAEPRARVLLSSRLLLPLGLFAVLLACAGSVSAAPIPGQYIVVLKSGASEQAAEAAAKNAGADVFLRYKHALNGYAARLSNAQLAKVAADSRVLSISPDTTVTAAASLKPPPPPPVQPAQTLPTGVDRVDGDRSSSRSGDSRGSVDVNVAVVDTGIDPDHPDLNVVGGQNCRDGTSYADGDGHGSNVAGIVGAKDDGIGVVGVAPGTPLWAVRVLGGNGAGSKSSVLCGIDWVTSTRTDGDPANDIAVANMSLGGKGGDDQNCGQTNRDVLHQAVCASTAAGVTYVVAAMNDGRDFQGTIPASYDEVLTVSAMTDLDGRPGGLAPAGATCMGAYPVADDTPAGFSGFATLPSDQAHTVAAPGVCIYSDWKYGGYSEYSGTSQATPHATGTVALCIGSGACAGLAPAQIIQRLRSDAAAYNARNPGYGFTGDPLHAPDPNKQYGYLMRAGLY